MTTEAPDFKFRALDSEGNDLIRDPYEDESRLYYEAHVTIPPIQDTEELAFIDQLCAANDWRRSTFEMHKDKIPNAFISCRDKSLASMERRVVGMVCTLRNNGHTVLRYKIEDTLLDSNRGDQLLEVIE